MEDFIKTREISSFKFYGIKIRLDLVIIDERSYIHIVTKRTCNKEDEETWTFTNINDAIVKYKNTIANIKTTWGSDVSKLIP